MILKNRSLGLLLLVSQPVWAWNAPLEEAISVFSDHQPQMRKMQNLEDWERRFTQGMKKPIFKSRLRRVRNLMKDLPRQFPKSSRMVPAIRELVSNGLDASQPPVSPEVQVEFDPSKAKLGVRDLVGMDPETWVKVILPGFSSKKRNEKKIGRFGMGFYSNLGFLSTPQDQLEVLTRPQSAPTGYRLRFYKPQDTIQLEILPDPNLKVGTEIVVQSELLKNLDPAALESDLKGIYELYTSGLVKLNGKILNHEILDLMAGKPSPLILLGQTADIRLYEDLKAPRQNYGSLKITVGQLKNQEMSFYGKEIAGRLILDFSNRIQISPDRMSLPYSDENLKGQLVQLVQKLAREEKIRILNSLYPILNYEHFNVLSLLSFKFSSFVLPDDSSLYEITEINGKEPHWIHPSLFDRVLQPLGEKPEQIGKMNYLPVKSTGWRPVYQFKKSYHLLVQEQFVDDLKKDPERFLNWLETVSTYSGGNALSASEFNLSVLRDTKKDPVLNSVSGFLSQLLPGENLAKMDGNEIRALEGILLSEKIGNELHGYPEKANLEASALGKYLIRPDARRTCTLSEIQEVHRHEKPSYWITQFVPSIGREYFSKGEINKTFIQEKGKLDGQFLEELCDLHKKGVSYEILDQLLYAAKPKVTFSGSRIGKLIPDFIVEWILKHPQPKEFIRTNYFIKSLIREVVPIYSLLIGNQVIRVEDARNLESRIVQLLDGFLQYDLSKQTEQSSYELVRPLEKFRKWLEKNAEHTDLVWNRYDQGARLSKERFHQLYLKARHGHHSWLVDFLLLPAGNISQRIQPGRSQVFNIFKAEDLRAGEEIKEIREAIGTYPDLVNQVLGNAVTQNLDQSVYILETFKNSQEAKASQFKVDYYLAEQGKPYLNIEDDGTGIPANRDRLFSLVVPNDGEKRSLVKTDPPSGWLNWFKWNLSEEPIPATYQEDPNYGWGFWTAIARYPKVIFETRHRDTWNFVSYVYFDRTQSVIPRVGTLTYDLDTASDMGLDVLSHYGSRIHLTQDQPVSETNILIDLIQIQNKLQTVENLEVQLNSTPLERKLFSKKSLVARVNIDPKRSVEIHENHTPGVYYNYLKMSGETQKYLDSLPKVLQDEVYAHRYSIVFRGVFGQTMSRNDFVDSESLLPYVIQAVQQAAIRDLVADKIIYLNSLPRGDFFSDFTYEVERKTFNFEQNLTDFVSHLHSKEQIRDALNVLPVYGTQINLVDVRIAVIQALKRNGLLNSQNQLQATRYKWKAEELVDQFVKMLSRNYVATQFRFFNEDTNFDKVLARIAFSIENRLYDLNKNSENNKKQLVLFNINQIPEEFLDEKQILLSSESFVVNLAKISFGESVAVRFKSGQKELDPQHPLRRDEIVIDLHDRFFEKLKDAFSKRNLDSSAFREVLTELCHEIAHLKEGTRHPRHGQAFGRHMMEVYKQGFLQHRMGDESEARRLFFGALNSATNP